MARATKEESRATGERVLAAARALFGERGLAAVSLEEIATRAAVTRGAVYHHYASKTGMFRAVHAQAQQEVASAIEEATASVTDPWEALEVGCRAFLEASVRDGIRQIMLVDAPVVLGWDTWRDQDAGNSGRLLRHALDELADAGILDVGSVAACHALLSGAMNEAALWAASTDDPQSGIDDAWALLQRMLRSLARTTP